MKPLDSLAVSQVDRRLKAIRMAFKETHVQHGWIRYMRQALSMTLKKLAERSEVSLATVAQAERGEAAGKVTVATLKTMAEAMQCEFVYAFVPKTDASIEEILRKAAVNKAKHLLSTTDTHMTLENQRVEGNFEERVERLAHKLIAKGDVW